MNKDIFKGTTSTILDEPIHFTIKLKKRNLAHKIGIISDKKHFSISGITLGAMIQVSEIIVDIKGLGEYDQSRPLVSVAFDSIKEDLERMVRVVALCINNSKERPSEKLIDFLKFNLDASELNKLYTVIVSRLNINDFISTIIAMKGMSLMKTEESIASGELSEDI